MAVGPPPVPPSAPWPARRPSGPSVRTFSPPHSHPAPMRGWPGQPAAPGPAPGGGAAPASPRAARRWPGGSPDRPSRPPFPRTDGRRSPVPPLQLLPPDPLLVALLQTGLPLSHLGFQGGQRGLPALRLLLLPQQPFPVRIHGGQPIQFLFPGAQRLFPGRPRLLLLGACFLQRRDALRQGRQIGLPLGQLLIPGQLRLQGGQLLPGPLLPGQRFPVPPPGPSAPSPPGTAESSRSPRACSSFSRTFWASSALPSSAAVSLSAPSSRSSDSLPASLLRAALLDQLLGSAPPSPGKGSSPAWAFSSLGPHRSSSRQTMPPMYCCTLARAASQSRWSFPDSLFIFSWNTI